MTRRRRTTTKTQEAGVFRPRATRTSRTEHLSSEPWSPCTSRPMERPGTTPRTGLGVDPTTMAPRACHDPASSRSTTASTASMTKYDRWRSHTDSTTSSGSAGSTPCGSCTMAPAPTAQQPTRGQDATSRCPASWRMSMVDTTTTAQSGSTCPRTVLDRRSPSRVSEDSESSQLRRWSRPGSQRTTGTRACCSLPTSPSTQWVVSSWKLMRRLRRASTRACRPSRPTPAPPIPAHGRVSVAPTSAGT